MVDRRTVLCLSYCAAKTSTMSVIIALGIPTWLCSAISTLQQSTFRFFFVQIGVKRSKDLLKLSVMYVHMVD